MASKKRGGKKGSAKKPTDQTPLQPASTRPTTESTKTETTSASRVSNPTVPATPDTTVSPAAPIQPTTQKPAAQTAPTLNPVPQRQSSITDETWEIIQSAFLGAVFSLKEKQGRQYILHGPVKGYTLVATWNRPDGQRHPVTGLLPFQRIVLPASKPTVLRAMVETPETRERPAFEYGMHNGKVTVWLSRKYSVMEGEAAQAKRERAAMKTGDPGYVKPRFKERVLVRRDGGGARGRGGRTAPAVRRTADGRGGAAVGRGETAGRPATWYCVRGHRECVEHERARKFCEGCWTVGHWIGVCPGFGPTMAGGVARGRGRGRGRGQLIQKHQQQHQQRRQPAQLTGGDTVDEPFPFIVRLDPRLGGGRGGRGPRGGRGGRGHETDSGGD